MALERAFDVIFLCCRSSGRTALLDCKGQQNGLFTAISEPCFVCQGISSPRPRITVYFPFTLQTANVQGKPMNPELFSFISNLISFCLQIQSCLADALQVGREWFENTL